MKIDLNNALVAAIVSSVVSVIIAFIMRIWQSRVDIRASLDAQLDSILKIAVQYPYLESESFTNSWKVNSKKVEEKYRRYEVYATLVFNYLSRVCAFFKYNEKKIYAYIDMKGWVELHHQYWHNPTKENENEQVYDEKFKKLVHAILGEMH